MKCDCTENFVARIHIGNEIAGVMARGRYSPSWLARVLFCDLLMRISVALHHDFFRIYSDAFDEIMTADNKNCETPAPQSRHHNRDL